MVEEPIQPERAANSVEHEAGAPAKIALVVPASQFQLALVSFLIATVVYTNSAVILNIALRKAKVSFVMPMFRYTDNLFALHGMFSSYFGPYHEFEIYGVTPPTEIAPRGRTIILNRADFFPFTPGYAKGRAEIAKLARRDKTRWQDALRLQSAKIRARHNLLHPDNPIEKIIIAYTDWPRITVPFEMLDKRGETEIIYSDE